MPCPIRHLAQQRQIETNLRERLGEVVTHVHGIDVGV